MTDVASLTVEQVQHGLRAKQFSAEELAKSTLEFAETESAKTNAFLSFSPERALAAAKRACADSSAMPALILSAKTCSAVGGV